MLLKNYASKIQNIVNILLRNYNSCSKHKFDISIVGGGIIGTSIARKIKYTFPGLSTIILEKEAVFGKHQTSHNSGVLHCGIYYEQGSLKSKLCTEGLPKLKLYCKQKGIRINSCGKLILAIEPTDIPGLKLLYERGKINQVPYIQYLDSNSDIRKIIPQCRALQGIWIEDSSNVNFKNICDSLVDDFVSQNGKTKCNFEVEKITKIKDDCYPLALFSTEHENVLSKIVILCCGLQSEKLTMIVENEPPKEKCISLKVDYKLLRQKTDGINCNIYAVPDLSVPFLGPHISPTGDGDILLGPWTFPALKTEGYSNDELNFTHLKNLLRSSAFRNMVIKNFSKCLNQVSRSLLADLQIKDLQRLLPEIPYCDIEDGPTAVQCQMFNESGTFVNDFLFDIFIDRNEISRYIINCKHIPSPGATSCLAIADYVTDKLATRLECLQVLQDRTIN